jgi:hypothetical protein
MRLEEFEAYTRQLMTSKQPQSLESRVYVFGEEVITQDIVVERCNRIQQVGDIVLLGLQGLHAMSCFTLRTQDFHSLTSSTKVRKVHLRAFRVTIGESHKSESTTNHRTGENCRLGGRENLTLYYLVPGTRFAGFFHNA